MLHDETNPLSWVIKADRDLELAEDMLSNWARYPDLICYHCQQSAEKHLKSLLVFHGSRPRKTHDLRELLDLISDWQPEISSEHYDWAGVVNDYAVIMRYPGRMPDPSHADVLEALAAARFFRAFALKIIQP